jgi:Cytosol aminopeptidase family, N-terminal domain
VEGDIFTSPPALPAAANGMVHLDEALAGAITELRRTGRFAGHSYETLLIAPRPGVIAAQRLLLIGLGDRAAFRPELMTGIGRVAMREALRLGVTSFAFASDLKDAGVDSPTALVARNVVLGMFEAYRTETWLANRTMAGRTSLSRVTLLAGPAFYAVAGEGIKEAIATLEPPGSR